MWSPCEVTLAKSFTCRVIHAYIHFSQSSEQGFSQSSEQGFCVYVAQASWLHDPFKLRLNHSDGFVDIWTRLDIETLVYVLKQVAFGFQEFVVVEPLLDFEGQREVVSQTFNVSHSSCVDVSRVALLEERQKTEHLLFLVSGQPEFVMHIGQESEDDLEISLYPVVRE
ncbi:MAG: hypothetical protein KVP17_003715 [Porospora cf. gigantea B]|uniref:uncharacterized protein n=1 Tax=Porospora cf. gigantea B TaxID=2853592 RepID=UPI003571E29B|nr:MAG: hypothetical protein KVP17_003715 [Porospora cf. gigantea B]